MGFVNVGRPPKGCRSCGAPGRRRRELSASGLCANCGPRLQVEATLQLIDHSGPYFERWRKRCLAAFTSPRIETPRPIPNVTTFELPANHRAHGGNI